MNGVRGIKSLAAGDAPYNLFRILGPTLLVSMGYLDLGKWLIAVDAGTRFGYDLVLLVMLFNFTAILCQYLSICIGIVTRKNIAEICCQEYNQAICVVLGLQAGLSLLTSEITMIAGLAVGFSVLFDYDDLITSICFASVIVILLPYTLSHLDKRMAGMFNACIAGFTLLCFVLGLLISHPKTPVNMKVMFPKLSGESAYSLMALLGSNIIVHNFYTHSAIAQVQRSPFLTLGSLFHDHLFSILFIFSGFFLANYILLSTAADESSKTVIANFHNAMDLMHQVFTNPAAPVVLLVILLFSSHGISLTCVISSDVISENFFGIKLPLYANHIIPKGLAMIPAIYFAKATGPEGIYQLLIMCPVIQAMLLPSSVIPMLRVSSSSLLMRRYKISMHVEVVTSLAFLLMLCTNIIFAAEILFGDSTWTDNLKGYTGSPVILPYTVVVIILCASIAFTLFLAVTPLKSENNEAQIQLSSVLSQTETLDINRRREDNSEREEVHGLSIGCDSRGSLKDCQKSALEHSCRENSQKNFVHEQVQRSSFGVAPRDSLKGQKSSFERPCGAVTTEESDIQQLTAQTAIASTVNILEHSPEENMHIDSTTEKVVELEEEGGFADKDTVVSCNLKYERPAEGNTPLTSDGQSSLSCSKEKDSDAGNISVSLSRMSGLGHAARRQLAVILDEFWGLLFDYHGELTHEANTKGFNFLVRLGLTVANPAVGNDNPSTEASWSPLMRNELRGSDTLTNSWHQVSRDKDIASPKFTFGLQTSAKGSSIRPQSLHLRNRDVPHSGRNIEPYLNFKTRSYTGNHYYQPATIHGYNLATHLTGMNASRGTHSRVRLDLGRFPRSSESSIPTYTETALRVHKQNAFGSLGTGCFQGPDTSWLRTMVVERPYYDSNQNVWSGSVDSSSYSKKYHSLPDISEVIAASRYALPNKVNLGGPDADMAELRRLASGKSMFEDSAARPPPQLALNELLQHDNVQKDILTMQPSMNISGKSLCDQQPFQQFFSVPSAELNKSELNIGRRSSSATEANFCYAEFEAELLQSLRFCIMKLLKLEGSQWLFMQSGGCDETLINLVSEAVRVSQEETIDDRGANHMCGLPNCGDDCVWRASLIVSFGIWCIHRVLHLGLVENRPELWGKYTYILNRLQGILDVAFSKPRQPLKACVCLEKASPIVKPIPGTFTTASTILELIKDVEQAVSGRKGRSGTTAIAFSKGKKNLASVLRRYKRRLCSKSSVVSG